MASYRIEKALDSNQLAKLSCQVLANHISLALDVKDRVQIALSGGSTPLETYRLLGQQHLPWDRVDIFLGDERWVEDNHSASNAAMIRKSLLASAPGNNCRFHPVPTVQYSTPSDSAKAFDEILQKVCVGSPPIFDLIFLGLGEDGHTASLFPNSEALQVLDSWSTYSFGNGFDRITLTAPVLSAARQIIFLVSGKSKQSALKRLLDPAEPFNRTPAKLVQPNNEILILTDEQAAFLL